MQRLIRFRNEIFGSQVSNESRKQALDNAIAGCEYYNKNNNFKKALPFLDEAIELNPYSSLHHRNRGVLYFQEWQNQNFEEKNEDYLANAQYDFQMVININTSTDFVVDSHRYLGMIHYEKKEYHLALEHLNAFFKMSTEKDYEAQAYRALTHAALNNYADAILDNVQILKIDPNRKFAKDRLKIVFEKLKSHLELNEENRKKKISFEAIEKHDLFFAIKQLSNEKAIPLLKLCLSKDNPLGERMRKKEVLGLFRKECILAEISEYLRKLQGHRTTYGKDILFASKNKVMHKESELIDRNYYQL